MKKIIACFLIAAASLGVSSLQAQTADEIVNKHIEAIGGKDKIKQVQSLYMEGSFQIMGNESPTTVTLVSGKGYKTESEFNGQKIVQCITDKGGWAINPMNGGNAEAMPDAQYNSAKEQLDPGGALFDYAAKGSKVELLGKEGNAYKLKLTSKEKEETTYFIDAGTFYLTKLIKKGNMMGQEIEIAIQLADYRKTDIGFLIPFSISTDMGQFQFSTAIKKAEVNKTIDPAVFAMPK